MLTTRRCWLSAVLSPLDLTPEEQAVFQDAQERGIPDPSVYSEWWDQADEREQRLAVGSRRYSAVKQKLGTDAGRLANGKKIEFVAHPNQDEDETTVYVDPQKLNAAWQVNKGFHLPSGAQGESEVAGRREGFQEFLKKGEPIQASRVTFRDDGSVDFVDGRHRFAVLRDAGADRVAVTVPKSEAEKFKDRFGVSVKAPEWEHFLDPETGSLLKTPHLLAETPEKRAERVAAVKGLIAERRDQLHRVAAFGFLPENQS